MAYASITAALAELNNNLDWWTSASKASAFAQAATYLLVNRAQTSSIAGSTLNFESLKDDRDKALIQAQSAVAGTSTTPRRSFTQGRAKY